MIDLGKKTVTAVREFCIRRKITALSFRHVHPTCHVLDRVGLGLLVKIPSVEPENPASKKNPSVLVSVYEPSLKPGDLCSMAYANTAHGAHGHIAVKSVEAL